MSELGLDRGQAEVRRLARLGARLPAGDSPVVGFAGARADAPSLARAEPGGTDSDGRAGEVGVSLDLGALGGAVGAWPALPREGWASIAAGEGEVGQPRTAEVVFGPEAKPPPGAVALRATGELLLPRAWSKAVEPLALSDSEQQAWQLLRERLAVLQGVAAIDGGPAPAPIHRFLGYPDERRGDMPLRCELHARGLEVDWTAPQAHPDAGEAAAGCGRWWLLAQLDTDPELGWAWPRGRRLYLWAAAAEGPGLAVLGIYR
ncbi:MAG: hypothetical protein U0R71_14575 [Solirubrobacterales bacterium]